MCLLTWTNDRVKVNIRWYPFLITIAFGRRSTIWFTTMVWSSVFPVQSLSPLVFLSFFLFWLKKNFIVTVATGCVDDANICLLPARYCYLLPTFWSYAFLFPPIWQQLAVQLKAQYKLYEDAFFIKLKGWILCIANWKKFAVWSFCTYFVFITRDLKSTSGPDHLL